MVAGVAAPKPGAHRYRAEIRGAGFSANASGEFSAKTSRCKGLLRVDRAHPWHFAWEGTGEHFFSNSTDAY
jgi:hypothetical protein